MKKIWIGLLVLCAAQAGAVSMRCGQKLMTDGDSMNRVRVYCGSPAKSVESLRPSVAFNRIGVPLNIATESVWTEWTYNFGPNRLMMKVTFQDDKLVDVETLGYGY